MQRAQYFSASLSAQRLCCISIWKHSRQGSVEKQTSEDRVDRLQTSRNNHVAMHRQDRLILEIHRIQQYLSAARTNYAIYAASPMTSLHVRCEYCMYHRFGSVWITVIRHPF